MRAATKTRVIFMGTSAFAVNSLQALAQVGHDIPLVVTQPDRPRGRGQQPAFSPVKEQALKLGLNLFQPERLRDSGVITKLTAIAPDFVVVASYGQMIPEEILILPNYCCLNIHASLLPRYRGAAPIQRAIMNGESMTGITIMHMDKTLDTGDIILQQPLFMENDWNYSEVEDRLAMMGAALLLDAIQQIMRGVASRIPQENHLATYARRILREDEYIDWRGSAVDIFNQIRALSPSPGACSRLEHEGVKVFKAAIAKGLDSDLPPGSITALTPGGFTVQTGSGQLELQSVQRSGKKRMDAKSFAAGQRLVPGKRFDEHM
ncbi:MAG: methionyl-tRNA formyltransferase [Syntrophomonadaceae bacterium]|nr:methionyl-tRNA formyltransferase [Syntrophomonadaceae bacterium]